MWNDCLSDLHCPLPSNQRLQYRVPGNEIVGLSCLPHFTHQLNSILFFSENLVYKLNHEVLFFSFIILQNVRKSNKTFILLSNCQQQKWLQSWRLS